MNFYSRIIVIFRISSSSLTPRTMSCREQVFERLGRIAKAQMARTISLLTTQGKKFFDDQQAKDARRQLAEQIDNWQSTTSSPQLDLIDRADLLLSDILDICGDRKNTAAYFTILKAYPEPLIRMALSETRQAQLEGCITKSRGAYFTDTLKRLLNTVTLTRLSCNGLQSKPVRTAISAFSGPH